MSKKTKPIVEMHSHPHGARAMHFVGADGSQIAFCDGLRVLITKSEGKWIAQGLEIDYAIDGDSVPDVKRRFEEGLSLTIQSNMRVYNDLKVLLQIAPQDVWDQWNDAKNTLRRFEHTTLVATAQKQQQLPFDAILWLDASNEEKVA